MSRPLRSTLQVDRNLSDQSANRRIVCEVSRLWSVPAIVAETDLIGQLPRWFANRVADWFGLEVHDSPYAFDDHFGYMMWHERNERDQAHAWLRQQVLTGLTESYGPLPPDDAAGETRE